MIRAVLSTLFCFAALVVGLRTACLAAENRARRADLNADQRLCEMLSRQNDVLRQDLEEREWSLLMGEPDPEAAEGADDEAQQALDAADGTRRNALEVEH